MARALVVQHLEIDAPARVGSTLDAAGVDVVVHRTDLSGPPPAVDGFDALVVMGGPRSAHSDTGFPTRRAELDLLADAVGRGLAVLGVCLGAQLLVEATGGRAVRGAAGLEVGWAEVALAPEASDDELFSVAPAAFTPLHWHGDTVVLPPEAALLASSARYPNQAFRVGARAWGIQFHLEADRALVEAFAAAWPSEADQVDGGAAGIVADADPRLASMEPVVRSILGQFASLASGVGGR